MPFACNAYLATLNFWHRLEIKCHENDNSLVKIAYELNKQENLNWYKSVQAITNSLNLNNHFDNPDPEINFKYISKLSIYNGIRQQWMKALKSNKKLTFYSIIKKEMCFEQYLQNMSNYKDRKILTKFRCSNHSLQIEKGRHSNTPRKDRICQLCNKQVETEKHLLTYCPKFNSIRHPDLTKNWYSILKSHETEQLSKLTCFLRNAQRIREST